MLHRPRNYLGQTDALKISSRFFMRDFSCCLLPWPDKPGGVRWSEATQSLLDSLTAAETMFPNCGLIITGDFNRLNTGRLQCHFKLKQLVKFPTRGDATPDLVLTNLGDHFSTPECFPPFGLSDHCTVIVQPRKRVPNQHTRKSITIRDISDSNKMCLGRYFSSINWSIVTSRPTCEEKLQVFNEVIEIGMSNILPERTI